jgi:hypothetical protein
MQIAIAWSAAAERTCVIRPAWLDLREHRIERIGRVSAGTTDAWPATAAIVSAPAIR